MKPLGSLFLSALLLVGLTACRDRGGESQAEQAATGGIATVGEVEITEAEKDELGNRVLSLLLDRYAAENQIGASEEEVDKFLARLREAESANPTGDPDSSEDSLSEAEKKELAGLRDGMARAVIKAWKVNRALFDEYGGRVIYQQGGPEPLDAYRKFLEAQLKAGAFTLADRKYEADLWRIFTDDELHDFVPEDQRKDLIHTPPWEQKRSGE